MPFIRKAIATLTLVVLAAGALTVQPADAATTIRFTRAGDLTVLGDNSSEVVRIGPVSSGLWEVEVTSPTSTTVRQFTERPRSISVNTRGGDDSVTIEDLADPIRNLTVNLGSGYDQAALDDLDVTGQFRVVTTGSSTTDIEIDRLQVDGRTTITLGNGHHFFSSRNTVYKNNYRLTTGANSRIDLTSSLDQYRRTVDVRTGNGRDLLSWSTQVSFSGPSVRINTRGGNDDVLLRYDTYVSSRLNVRLGAGNDKARMIEFGATGRVDVRGDAGDDLIQASYATFADQTRFDGGSGTADTYDEVGSAFAVGRDLFGFETTS